MAKAAKSWISLGYLTIAAGTPVSLTENLPPQAAFNVRAISIEHAKSANTGLVYVQNSANDVRSTGRDADGNGVLFVLAAPTLNGSSVATSLPSISPGTSSPGQSYQNPFELYVDGDHTGDVVLASYLPA